MDIICQNREPLRDLGVFWCTKYQCVIDGSGGLCRGCKDLAEIREDLKEKAKRFDGCWVGREETGSCGPFGIEVDRDLCGKCRGSNGVRARLYIEYYKNMVAGFHSEERNSIDRTIESLEQSFTEIEKLVVGNEFCSVLDRAIRCKVLALQKRRKKIV